MAVTFLILFHRLKIAFLHFFACVLCSGSGCGKCSTNDSLFDLNVVLMEKHSGICSHFLQRWILNKWCPLQVVDQADTHKHTHTHTHIHTHTHTHTHTNTQYGMMIQLANFFLQYSRCCESANWVIVYTFIFCGYHWRQHTLMLI